MVANFLLRWGCKSDIGLRRVIVTVLKSPYSILLGRYTLQCWWPLHPFRRLRGITSKFGNLFTQRAKLLQLLDETKIKKTQQVKWGKSFRVFLLISSTQVAHNSGVFTTRDVPKSACKDWLCSLVVLIFRTHERFREWLRHCWFSWLANIVGDSMVTPYYTQEVRKTHELKWDRWLHVKHINHRQKGWSKSYTTKIAYLCLLP